MIKLHVIYSLLEYFRGKLFSKPLCVFRASKKPTETGLVWRRTSWSRPTLSGRKQPRHAERRRREPRRRGSWMKRILRDSVVWRSETLLQVLVSTMVSEESTRRAESAQMYQSFTFSFFLYPGSGAAAWAEEDWEEADEDEADQSESDVNHHRENKHSSTW